MSTSLLTSLQANSEFDNFTAVQPEFSSDFNSQSTSINIPQAKKATKVVSKKAKIKSVPLKFVTITKHNSAKIKAALKDYSVVYTQEAITRKPPKAQTEHVAKQHNASTVIVKAYTKDHKQLYSLYYLRKN